MALSSLNGVKVSGIVSCVPAKRVDNFECEILGSREEAEKFVKTTGIRYRHIVEDGVCTSDLCKSAAESLITGLQWKKDEIDIIILVTQTPDYLAPNTAVILQHRLGLSKSCIAFDMTLGCSGYVYGLSVMASMLKSLNLKRGILLVGDTLSRQASPFDKSAYPLFGDAGTATAVEITSEHDDKMTFLLGSDGEGYRAIIVPGSGYREPITAESLEFKQCGEGICRSGINTIMEGADVFSFGISVIPAEVRKFYENFGFTNQSFDFAFFHQANKFMNEKIRKKIGFSEDQVPYSLEEYGNTSSATIPLTISFKYNEEAIKATPKVILMCGFGVGLSWGISSITTGPGFFSSIIEY